MLFHPPPVNYNSVYVCSMGPPSLSISIHWAWLCNNTMCSGSLCNLIYCSNSYVPTNLHTAGA